MGFVAGFCVSPLPVHVGCCPDGVLPPPFEHDAGEIFADATLTASIRSAIAKSTATVARSLMRFITFLSCVGCIFANTGSLWL